MHIRREDPADFRRIHALNCAAFGSAAEADLVDALRARAAATISIVAEEDREIVGHILFSPVVIDGADDVCAMALAPMAVAPGHQRLGIGTALVRAGLSACQRDSVHAAFVVGHATYYPRFGFTRASLFGIGCAFDVSDEAFFAIDIVAGILAGKSGVVRYPDAFNAVTNGH